MDLFRIVNDVPETTLDLSGLYLSLSYKISGRFSVNGSYDARKNVVYYETYKTFTDRILEEGMRQGYRLSCNWRITGNMVAGIHAGYRFLKSGILTIRKPERVLHLQQYRGVNFRQPCRATTLNQVTLILRLQG